MDSMNNQDWLITNGTVVQHDKIIKTGGCSISRGQIQSIIKTPELDSELLQLNLHGLQVFPGFINGHDTLLASYLPVPARNRPYLNWLAWDNELKSSLLFKERMLIEPEQLYRLGSYRNLLCGVTAVVDHIPHFVRDSFLGQMPVFLLPDFGISHSVGTYNLNWGESVRQEYEKAVSKNLPFIIHIAEGYDQESRNSLRTLDELGGLGENTVLVHGLSLNDGDLDRIEETGASIVWCPSTNQYIYDKSMPIERILERKINVCLGTDAAMNGSLNLFDDIKQASAQFEKAAGAPLSPRTLFDMITHNAARAFRLSSRGMIKEKATADLVVLKGKYADDPYKSLFEAELPQIFLIIRDGLPVYGDPSLEPIFTELGVLIDRISVQGAKKIIQKGLKKLLEDVKQQSGRSINFPFIPVT